MWEKGEFQKSIPFFFFFAALFSTSPSRFFRVFVLSS